MARRIDRGDIWLHRFAPPDKRRPVVVLSRQRAIDLLDSVLVAAVTSKVRGAPAEVALGVEHGLKTASAANLDNVHTVYKRDLERYVGTLPAALMRDVCRALAVATGCGG